MKKLIIILLFILSLSICLNLFQWSNATVTCENIDAHPPTTTTTAASS